MLIYALCVFIVAADTIIVVNVKKAVAIADKYVERNLIIMMN